MNEPYDRLKAARIRAGYDTALSACEAFGWKQSAYSHHETGRNGFAKVAGRYAKAFRVSVEWLLTGKGSIDDPNSRGDVISVPVIDVRASAGAGALNVDDADALDVHLFSENDLSRLTRSSPEQLRVIRVSGDSMWDTLHDGDLILVDLSQARLGRDGIYVLLIGEELVVKRCSLNPATKQLTVKSDNPQYPAYEGLDPDSVTPIGRAVWISRYLG